MSLELNLFPSELQATLRLHLSIRKSRTVTHQKRQKKLQRLQYRNLTVVAITLAGPGERSGVVNSPPFGMSCLRMMHTYTYNIDYNTHKHSLGLTPYLA